MSGINYSEIAESYNRLHSEEQKRKLKLIKSLIKIPKSAKLLDIGAGTGISTIKTDYSVSLEPCKELHKQNPNKNKVLAEAENIPFKDNTFDIIISITAIHNFSNIEQAIKEIKRVLKPNGKIIITILKKAKHHDKIIKLLEQSFPNTKQNHDDLHDVIVYTD